MYLWQAILEFSCLLAVIVNSLFQSEIILPGSVGIKLLALKFLEMFVLLFASDISDSEKLATKGGRQAFNVLWLVGGHPHPVLDPVVLMSEGNRTLGILLNLLQSVGTLPGCLTITVVNW
ncbi:hypothetical protein LR48_Vigan04g202400 [Vigna angularis]|uniref:Symplekin/Pta1 N-terminal domain-containing protein n=1 Tax=Phaseolus angularis TaxID=3914 RepID=A0A0L9UGI4_PHAAN|nr:hypothetical protein LR48_Vigan04g202400 [Vigna angularis]